jgi:(2Fe-2S) ferredoxin
MSRLRRHFFVCTNEREADAGMPSCRVNGSQSVLEALRSARFAHDLIREVYVTETACLGPCPRNGATIVVYPEGVWYTGVRAEDVDEIVREHMLGGRTVARLRDRDWG